MNEFRLSIPCAVDELMGLRRALGEWLQEHAVPAEQSFHVRLVANEAASSAIERSRSCDSVTVQAAVDGTDVRVEVLDSGEPEAGSTGAVRGLTLIQAVASVALHPQEAGNRLVMHVRPGAPTNRAVS